jgi:hypothetical protein
VLQSRAHDQAADPAEPVDRNPYRHGSPPNLLADL